MSTVEDAAENSDPPGEGRAGRVRHGVDEAPVPDAGSTIRILEERAFSARCAQAASSIADARFADEVAVSVVLANPAAAARGVVVVVGLIGRNRAANDGGADDAGAKRPNPNRNAGLEPGWWRASWWQRWRG